jgi:hypothetical protein
VLRLAGPGAATTGQPVPVTVTDGQDGSPQAGASVGGELTGSDGVATPTFQERGIYRLKAERADSIRSNVLVLCVDPPGADPCSSPGITAPTVPDSTAPTVHLLLAGGYLSDTSTSRTFRISWQGDDGTGGSGIASYGVDVRQTGDARAASDDWQPVVKSTKLTNASFRAGSGRAYEFRVSAIDLAGNRGAFATGTVLVPIDDRDRSLLRFSRGWRRLERKGAWGRFVVRPRRVGASVRLRFRGTGAALIGRRLPNGGRLRVSIDGWRKVFRLRGTPRHRRVLLRTPDFPAGAHLLRLKALGGGPVEVDAVAAVP